jgi:hypothetical protein
VKATFKSLAPGSVESYYSCQTNGVQTPGLPSIADLRSLFVPPGGRQLRARSTPRYPSLVGLAARAISPSYTYPPTPTVTLPRHFTSARINYLRFRRLRPSKPRFAETSVRISQLPGDKPS